MGLAIWSLLWPPLAALAVLYMYELMRPTLIH